jgi:hypothetical protein
MSRGPLPFKQSDMTRAIKAAQAAGLIVRAIDVSKGMILFGGDVDSAKSGEGLMSWDQAIAELEKKN